MSERPLLLEGNKEELTWRQNLLLHSAVLVIVHREPVLQQEEEHVICLRVPNHHMLNVPGRVQTYKGMWHFVFN